MTFGDVVVAKKQINGESVFPIPKLTGKTNLNYLAVLVLPKAING